MNYLSPFPLKHVFASGLVVALLLFATSSVLYGQSFSERFEEIKREATPEELYRILYDLPKGGDLHNHLGGSGLTETLWPLVSDAEVNGGLRFYTRVRMNECALECSRPLLYFHTIRESVWQSLTPCCREEYEPLDELNARQREAWLSSIVLDAPGEGRNEFFEAHWARLRGPLSEVSILTELAVENMKLFAAEG